MGGNERDSGWLELTSRASGSIQDHAWSRGRLWCPRKSLSERLSNDAGRELAAPWALVVWRWGGRSCFSCQLAIDSSNRNEAPLLIPRTTILAIANLKTDNMKRTLTFALASPIPCLVEWDQTSLACGHSEHRQRRRPSTIRCWIHSRSRSYSQSLPMSGCPPSCWCSRHLAESQLPGRWGRGQPGPGPWRGHWWEGLGVGNAE